MTSLYDVGALVFGDKDGEVYRLLRRLGDGASAVVYEADDVCRGHRVAFKLLRRGASRARSQREWGVLQSLRHPSIVGLVSFGFTRHPDRTPYLAMPFLGGAPLRTVLDAEGALGLERGVDHALELFSALAHAHRVGIVHRDLRPENVFLERAAPLVHRLVVLDFGLAYAAHTRAATAEGPGHPRYAAPELFYGGAPSFATDVYAAGLLLFEMLTGTHALGETAGDWRLTHSLLAPPPLDAVLPAAPPLLVALSASLLAKDARERPTADSCALILQCVRGALPVAGDRNATNEDGVDAMLRRLGGPADDEITQEDPPPVSLLRQASLANDTERDPPSSGSE